MNINVNRNEMQDRLHIAVTDANSSKTQHASREGKKEKESGSIFVGNLNMVDKQDARAMNVVQAQRKALRGKLGEFTNNQETNDMITGLEEEKSKLASDKMEAVDKVKEAQETRQQLKELYKVEDDSEEQKNLDLIEKTMKNPQTLNIEDIKKLKDMGPLTEYQSLAVEQIKVELTNKKISDSSQNMSNSLSKAITGIELNELKRAPMIEAQEASDKILEAASDTVISDIIKETKDNVDDKMEQTKEDAQKQAEDDKEQEERIEKQVEKQREAKEKVSDIQVNDKQVATDTQQAKVDESIENLEVADEEYDKMQEDIRKMLKQMNIPEYDIKGIALNEYV